MVSYTSAAINVILTQKHFVEVGKSDEFMNLGKKEVMDILSRDELYVTSEEQV